MAFETWGQLHPELSALYKNINDLDIKQFKTEYSLKTSIINAQLKNELLEVHFVDRGNLKISEFLLKNGADANCICNGQGSYKYPITSQTGLSDSYINNPLCMQTLIADTYLDTIPGHSVTQLPQKLELLIKYGLDKNTKNKLGMNLIESIVHLPAIAKHKTFDEDKERLSDNLSKTLVVAIKSGFKFNRSTFENGKDLFINAILEINNKNLLTQLGAEKGYNTYNKKMAQLLVSDRSIHVKN